MNFSDKNFMYGSLVFVGALIGLIVPKFITVILWVALVGGLLSAVYSVLRQECGAKEKFF